MVKQIISAKLHGNRKVFQKYGENFLRVSEFFWDTIQGEGVYIGHPAAFLRLQGCALNCSYCDTKKVWQIGSPYTFNELFELMDFSLGFITALKAGQHLIISGGSPLLQQEKLTAFLNAFQNRYGFHPFIEVENECIIMPDLAFVPLVDCWNNSPKLASSFIFFEKGYKPHIIRHMSGLPNSWFKFVIFSEDEWEEIEAGFLMPYLIKKERIILMPKGETREELEAYRPIVLQMAIENNVRYCTREHIILWDKKVGV